MKSFLYFPSLTEIMQNSFLHFFSLFHNYEAFVWDFSTVLFCPAPTCTRCLMACSHSQPAFQIKQSLHCTTRENLVIYLMRRWKSKILILCESLCTRYSFLYRGTFRLNVVKWLLHSTFLKVSTSLIKKKSEMHDNPEPLRDLKSTET